MKKMLKNIEVVVEDTYGVCLWLMPDDGYLGDEDGHYLSMEGFLNNPIVESKMRDAAIYYFGSEALLGEPFWMPGSRKITDSENDDHMERLIDGFIPDPVDAVKQLGKKGLA